MGSFHLLKTFACQEWNNMAMTASGGLGPDARATPSPLCTWGLEDTEETAGQSKFLIRGRTPSGMWIREPSGLPWWLSGKESTFQCRRCGFHPWSGKIPHATEHLSPCTTTTGPVL